MQTGTNSWGVSPATDELIVELARYRQELVLAPFAIQGETTPLLLPIGGKHKAMSRGAVHELVKGGLVEEEIFELLIAGKVRLTFQRRNN